MTSTPPTERVPFPLPAVRLPEPPSSASSERQPSLIGRAALAAVLLAGVPLLAIAVIVALVALNVGMWRLGRIQFGIVFVTGAALLGLGRALVTMVRRPPEPEDEVEIEEASEPELYDAVRKLAVEAGAPAPDRIALVADVNAYVREFGPFMGLVPGRRTLAIGAPLLDTLTVSQLRAVLAHELGHFAGGDTRLGPLAFRAQQGLARMVESLGRSWISSVFVAYWKLHRRVTAAVSRSQELGADRAAVQVAGRQAAADALQRIDVAARAEDLVRHAYLAPLLERGHRPDDLASPLRHVLADAGQVEALLEGEESEAAHPWATHPPTPQRIARVAALPDPDQVDVDERPARVLLRSPDERIRQAYERWLQLVTGGAQLETTTWDRWGDVVVASTNAERAHAVDGVLSRLGLAAGVAGIREVDRRGLRRELAAGLIAAGWRAGGGEERDVLFDVATTAVATRHAVDVEGARWVLSWTGPVQLHDRDGAVIDVEALVDRTLHGTAEEATTPDVASRRRRRGARGPDAPTADEGAPIDAARPSAPAAPHRPSGELPLPPAPSPPFAPSTGGWAWAAEIPVGVRKRAVLAVGDAGIAWDGATISYARIAAVATHIKRDQNGTKAELTLTLDDGAKTKVGAGTSMSSNADTILRAGIYLLDVLTVRVAPRLAEEAANVLRGGGTWAVGGIVLRADGIAPKKKPNDVTPWASVGEPTWDENGWCLVPVGGKKPLRVGPREDNVFALPTAIPLLRALFG